MLDFLSTSLFDCITKTSATNVHNYNSSNPRNRTNKKFIDSMISKIEEYDDKILKKSPSKFIWNKTPP